MNALTDADDDDEEDEPGQSLAFPPFYVLRTAARCPDCGEAMHVYALGCAAYHDAGDSRPIEQFHFVRRIESVPAQVLALLTPGCPGFFFDHEEESDAQRYLMNHCRCGARLDDEYLHGDVGAAFWPDTPEGFRQFKLFRLPIEEAIPVVSSYTIGGGEELDTEHAEPWRAGPG